MQDEIKIIISLIMEITSERVKINNKRMREVKIKYKCKVIKQKNFFTYKNQRRV